MNELILSILGLYNVAVPVQLDYDESGTVELW